MTLMQDKISDILKEKFNPEHLIVVNESDLHIGHAGHDGMGDSHFYVEIISEYFLGLSKLQAQREVYAALHTVMRDIHALRLSVRGK